MRKHTLVGFFSLLRRFAIAMLSIRHSIPSVSLKIINTAHAYPFNMQKKNIYAEEKSRKTQPQALQQQF